MNFLNRNMSISNMFQFSNMRILTSSRPDEVQAVSLFLPFIQLSVTIILFSVMCSQPELVRCFAGTQAHLAPRFQYDDCSWPQTILASLISVEAVKMQIDANSRWLDFRDLVISKVFKWSSFRSWFLFCIWELKHIAIVYNIKNAVFYSNFRNFTHNVHFKIVLVSLQSIVLNIINDLRSIFQLLHIWTARSKQ